MPIEIRVAVADLINLQSTAGSLVVFFPAESKE
jgi:hypothetical protein